MKWLSWNRNLKTRLIGETLFNTLFWMYFPFMAIYYSDAFGKTIGGMLMAIVPLMGMIGNLFGGSIRTSPCNAIRYNHTGSNVCNLCLV